MSLSKKQSLALTAVITAVLFLLICLGTAFAFLYKPDSSLPVDTSAPGSSANVTTDKDGYKVVEPSETYSHYATQPDPSSPGKPAESLSGFVPSTGKTLMEHLPSVGFNAGDWDVSGNLRAEDNAFIVERSCYAKYNKLDTSADGQSYAIEMTLKVEAAGDYRFGLTVEGGRRGNSGKSAEIKFSFDAGGMLLMLPGEGGNPLRAFMNYKPASQVRVRVDVHPSQNRLIYYCDGRVYGERVLNNTTDPQLGGGKAGFFFEGTKAYITAISVCAIDLPSRSWTYEDPAESNSNGEAVLPVSDKPADVIYCVKTADLDRNTQLTLACLQGLVNRDTPRIYVDYGTYGGGPGGNSAWYELLEAKGRTLVWDKSVDDLLVEFKDYYKGVILGKAYYARVAGYMPNVVSTLAGVMDGVYMTPDTYKRLSSAIGKEVLIDTQNRWESSIDAYKWLYDNFWDQCNHSMIAHITCDGTVHTTHSVRDYLIQNKVFCFASTDVVTLEDYYFYMDLLAATPANTPVLGIASRNGENPTNSCLDEDALFRACADFGKFFCYAFSNDNISIMSGLEIDGELKQKEAAPVSYDSGKTYASFTLSEGENSSWWYNLWRVSYRHDSRKEVAQGWSMPGMAYYLCKASIEWYYDNATETDYWYMDGCGIGDIYGPDTYGVRFSKAAQETLFDDYLALTRYVMEKTDTTVLRAFDVSYTITDETIAKYAKAIPTLTAMYTGYNGEPNGLTKNGNAYLVGDVAVFRTVVGSAAATYEADKDGGVLVDGIRNASKSMNFLNVFVLGNYCMNDSEALVYTQNTLGSRYVFVRPDVMAELLKQSKG